MEARRLRDALRSLLRTEQSAMAEFLIALADFDRHRGWELLGHASLFAFLVVELRLSRSSAFWRLSSARLIQRHPEVIEPLRDGRLCLSTTAELAKVLTSENMDSVMPRYYRLSAREAAEVTVELQPRAHPPLRTVVTGLETNRPTGELVASPRPQAALLLGIESTARTEGLVLTSEPTQSPCGPASGALAPVALAATPPRGETRLEDIEPLTADLRRLHITVSRQFLKELEVAKDGLSHAIPNATTEQVLQEALRLLLEKQARGRALVKRPRAVQPQASSSPTSTSTGPSPHRRDAPRAGIPAAVKRAVWARDGGRCCWPLDGGGTCGSTHQLELDHVAPWADWGGETQENLRLVCRAHNRVAARQRFGERCVSRYQGRATGGAG